MRIKVSVTRSHIRRGTMSGDNCPLALALKRVVKPVTLVLVTPALSYIGTVCIKTEVIELTHRANRFANQFDKTVTTRSGRAHLKPFSFHLDIPVDLLKQSTVRRNHSI